VPEGFSGRAVLRVGGVKLEAWVWLNGEFVTHHLGHSTGFDVDLTNVLTAVRANESVIAISNTRRDRLGCVIRGWKGCSAGITGPVSLHGSEPIGLKDGFVCLAPDGQLEWRAEFAGDVPSTPGLECVAADILRANGESILILAWDGGRNVQAGQEPALPLMGSIYGRPALEDCVLTWSLVSRDGGAAGADALHRRQPRTVGLSRPAPRR